MSCAGVSLHVESQGEGSAVIILHGFTGSSETMAGVARSLYDRHRTHRLDLVGHGRSEAPAALSPYRMENCMAQVVAAMDALALDGAHLLGYSMGARVALAIAANYPGRVRSAVLLGVSAGFADPAERALRVRADAQLSRRLRSGGLEDFVAEWMQQPLFASQQRLGRDFLAQARRQRLRNSAGGLARSLEGMGSADMPPLHGVLGRVEAPVLLLAGSEDLKFSAIARQLGALLPRAQVGSVPRAGHAAHLENPAAFNELVRTFFDRVEAGGPAAFSEQSVSSCSSHGLSDE